MPLIQLLLILIVVAVFVYLMNTYGAEYMDGKILKLINIVAVVGCVIFVLRVFGLFDYMGSIHVGR